MRRPACALTAGADAPDRQRYDRGARLCAHLVPRRSAQARLPHPATGSSGRRCPVLPVERGKPGSDTTRIPQHPAQ